MPVIRGTFASTAAHDYCSGVMTVKLHGSEIRDGCTGDVSVQYTGGTFRPPPLIPNPLPPFPVKATHVGDGRYVLSVEPSIWRPWEYALHLLGISVKISAASPDGTISGEYSMRGAIGIPPDSGVLHAQIVANE